MIFVAGAGNHEVAFRDGRSILRCGSGIFVVYVGNHEVVMYDRGDIS